MVSTTTPTPCLLLLLGSLSCSLPPHFLPPSPYPYASIYIQQPHTDTSFFRFYWKAWAKKKGFSRDLNWENVGIFFRVASSEFHRNRAVKLKVYVVLMI